MTLKLLHKRIKFAENMSVEILASKFLVVMGTYRRLSHTVLSCIFLMSTFLTGIDFR